MAKLDIRIKESGTESLKIELGGRSRLLYFIIFLFLTTAVFLSIDFSYDFTSSRIGGTLFTFALILLSLGVALTVRSFTIDKSTGLLTKNIGLPFGIYEKTTQSFPLGSRPRFLVRIGGGGYPEMSMRNCADKATRTDKIKGRMKVTLALETEEKTVTLCEGSSKDEIGLAGDYISKYLGIPLVSE